MEVIHFPAGRIGGPALERAALRTALGAATTGGARLRVMTGKGMVTRALFCARCAAPIEFGLVVHGTDTVCSVECSLGDGRPA